MLDLHFKFLDVMKAFVGRAKVIQIVVAYDKKIVLPLLVVTFHFLNPTIDGMAKATPIDDDSIFGAMTSNVATLHKLLKNESGLFHHSHVKPEDFLLPLAWWKSHEAEFPNVSFVVQKILRIPRSHIETKNFF
jgi:hypothetical protein